MMKKKIEVAINKQINAELGSAYLYFSMEAYFNSINLNGFANWMRMQAAEEIQHALKFVDHLNERGASVTLSAIANPKATWSSPLAAFQDTLKHEQKVTQLINDLVTLAIKENDYATQNFLQWFVDEQGEEEASATQIIEQIKLAGDSKGALFYINRELGGRGGSAE